MNAGIVTTGRMLQAEMFRRRQSVRETTVDLTGPIDTWPVVEIVPKAMNWLEQAPSGANQ